ncbi:MAG: hypothetical protein KBC95_03385 [Candidatus Peribacteraceae bacterium]|nr:hypothetical protein [Candidatus Peribacteraceae bacterium]
MASSYAINPFFKGLIDWESPDAVAVVGGYRDEAGRAVPLTPEEYLAAVRRAAKECPELAQTLARTIGAAVLAMEMQARGHRVTITSVEGCRHRVGPFLMTGHELVATLWAKVVRPHFALPPQRTGGDSCCTVEEARLVVDLALQGPAGDQKFVQCVTTSYHVRRADLALRDALRIRRAEGAVNLLPTLTPEQVFESARLVPGLEPLKRIVEAAALPESALRWERQGERLTRLLHTVSSLLERLTGGRFNLERRLAASRRLAFAEGIMEA